MKFSRQEHWSGLPFPSSGDLPDPGIELRSPALQVDSLLAEPQGKPCKAIILQLKNKLKKKKEIHGNLNWNLKFQFNLKFKLENKMSYVI